MSDERDQREVEYRSRGQKRRSVRAVHEQRQKWIEQILKRPIETWPRWAGDAEFEDLLNQLRRTKASAGRRRLLRYIVRRSDDAVWLEVETYVDSNESQHMASVKAEKALVRLRDQLVENEEAFESLRARVPRDRHQQLRALILASRRNPNHPQSKGARKKLLRRLRSLNENGELTGPPDH